MTLGKIAPAYRDRLRWHGWLLMAWTLGVGLCTTLLLRWSGLHGMAMRYAISAAAMYGLGFVLGSWWYARWWQSQPAVLSDRPRHASMPDEVAYDQDLTTKRQRLKWMEGLDFPSGAGDDPISALFAILGFVLLVVVVVFLLVNAPWLTTEALGAYMAEIVLEFVIGAAVVRRMVPPRNADEAVGYFLRKTWLVGLLLVCCGFGVGWILQDMNPQAQTATEVFQ